MADKEKEKTKPPKTVKTRSDEENSDPLMEEIKKLGLQLTGVEKSLKRDFDTRMGRMETSLKKEFDEKLATLNTTLSATIDTKIATLDQKLRESFKTLIEQERETAMGLTMAQVDLEITQMRASLSLVETNLTKKIKIIEFDPEVSLIVTGLPFEDGENPVKRVEWLFEQMNCEPMPTIKAAERMKPRGERPGVIKVELASTMEKVAVLRRKSVLKDREGFKKIYINGAKSHTERLLEINTRTLLAELPSGKNFFMTGSGRLLRRAQSDEADRGARSARPRSSPSRSAAERDPVY